MANTYEGVLFKCGDDKLDYFKDSSSLITFGLKVVNI